MKHESTKTAESPARKTSKKTIAVLENDTALGIALKQALLKARSKTQSKGGQQ